MAIEKYIIDKSDLTALLRGEDLAIQPKGNIRGFCVEIAGNLTNGDMIKAMFPNAETWVEYDSSGDVMRFDIAENSTLECFNLEWWNAPYKESEEE